MTMHDVMAFATGALLLLWVWPQVVKSASVATSFDKWNEARGIRFLVSNSSTAQSLAQSVSSLDAMTRDLWCRDEALRQRLDALIALNSEAGISAVVPLEQLHFEVDTEEILKRMWSEKAAVAYTSSNALVAMSVLMVISTGSLSWIWSSWWGIACGATSALLVVTARFWVRSLRRKALRIHSTTQTNVKPSLGIMLASAGLVIVMPNAMGVALALITFVALRAILTSLPQRGAIERTEHLLIERDWLLALIHSSTLSGHDWLKSFEIARPHMSAQMQEAIAPIITRLRWGIPATDAFDESLWIEVAHIAKQVQQLGIKSDVGLGHLRVDLNHTRRSSRISHLEKLAAKSVIPVSLLQLPAFIVLGIVPVVATQFSTLLTTYAPMMA